MAAPALQTNRLTTTWPVPLPKEDLLAQLSVQIPEQIHPNIYSDGRDSESPCLLYGEQVQDVQSWRRHLKQRQPRRKSFDPASGAVFISPRRLENID